MNPHYYLMKSKKILRLEAETSFESLSLEIRERVLMTDELIRFNQDQANWRVVIYRDEILELDEYQQWLKSPEAMLEEEYELELVAN